MPTDEAGAIYQQALKLVIDSRSATPSFIQRALKISYQDATELILRMHRDGHVGEAGEDGHRVVLASRGNVRNASSRGKK